jgi:hypothetical protein
VTDLAWFMIGTVVGAVWFGLFSLIAGILAERVVFRVFGMHVCPGHADSDHLKAMAKK